MRSTIITGFFTVLFIVVALVFWAWTASEVPTPVTTLNEMNSFLVPVIEVFTMFGFFVFLTVTTINLRHYITHIRAGWLEVVVLLIIVTALSWVMFTPSVAGPALVLFLGFVAYLYLLQD